jgi:hypothetical protein
MGPNGVIYHQKTITVDDATAAVGTGNLTPQYYPTSRDAWVLDTNPTDLAAITAVGSTFDDDYAAARAIVNAVSPVFAGIRDPQRCRDESVAEVFH